MMIVITLSSCPKKLKGDLTRWLFEIDTGVYVGNVSSRVRDALWDRICGNLGSGRASMAYSTNNEQKMDFRIHNTLWDPVDFDGINLVRRNFEKHSDSDEKRQSKASVRHMLKQKQRATRMDEGLNYTVIDIETTGISDDDEIIEIGALKIRDGNVADSLVNLVRCNNSIPKEITKLTGITDDMIKEKGIACEQAMYSFCEFIGDDILVGHNIRFDMKYIQQSCKAYGQPQIKNRIEDTMRLAKKKAFISEGYSLAAVCRHLGINDEQQHRAFEDCKLTYRIFEKLNEK